jgi:hypothetical protein
MEATMKRTACATFIACLVLASGANAQSGCPQGTTATGQCVDPALAANANQAAVIFSQPKISATAFPVLPVDDFKYKYPNNLVSTPQVPPPGTQGGNPLETTTP